MMEKILSCRVEENVYIILELKKKRVGELEKSLGLRHGYFSRQRGSNTKGMPIEIVYRTSELLEVPIQELIEVDWNKRIKLETMKKSLKELGDSNREIQRDCENLIKKIEEMSG